MEKVEMGLQSCRKVVWKWIIVISHSVFSEQKNDLHNVL